MTGMEFQKLIAGDESERFGSKAMMRQRGAEGLTL